MSPTRTLMLCLLACLLACLLVPAMPAQAVGLDSGSEDNWGQRLEQDARAMHAALAGSHPGPVDSLNPEFAPLLNEGLSRALARVPQTRDFGGYWWALREFQASFQDGHVQLDTTAQAPQLPIRWPGFLTGYDGDMQYVATRLPDEGLPPLGAILLECDGVPADALAERLVGQFRGRWSLESQHALHGGRLFLDAGNPWVERPRRCIFSTGGVANSYVLEWKPLEAAEFSRRYEATRSTSTTDTAIRDFGDGNLWISMAGFDGNPESEQFDLLARLVDALGKSPQVADAPRVVLDVRGNGGGSSHWATLVANQLWGSHATEHAQVSSEGVEWRISTENLQTIEAYGSSIRAQPSPDPVMLAWTERISGGLRHGMENGLALWKEPEQSEAESPSGASVNRRLKPDARVYVLADSSCASACLDALDLWRALGAVQVGRTTSADTLYMDVREQPLPSGLAQIAIPMKVYRGRPRGNNVPWTPRYRFPGEMDDGAALQAWISGLP